MQGDYQDFFQSGYEDVQYSGSGNVERGAEIVYVIDGTGSMKNLLEAAKNNALGMHQRISEALKNKNGILKMLRIKVIVFRDIYVDSQPLVQSPDFFSFPEEAEQFRRFIESIQASGGGDEPESGLEALHLAIKSNWRQNIGKMRHIIIVMTDASAHALDNPQRAVDPSFAYPTGMPESMDDLHLSWMDRQGRLSMSAKRMALFTPNAYPWNQIALWDMVSTNFSEAGVGLSEEDYSSVIKFISDSV